MIYAGYEGSDHCRINLPVLFIFLAMLLPSYPHAKKAFYLSSNNEAIFNIKISSCNNELKIYLNKILF